MQLFSIMQAHNKEAADCYISHTNLGVIDNLNKIYGIFDQIDRELAKFQRSRPLSIRKNE